MLDFALTARGIRKKGLTSGDSPIKAALEHPSKKIAAKRNSEEAEETARSGEGLAAGAVRASRCDAMREGGTGVRNRALKGRGYDTDAALRLGKGDKPELRD